MEDVRPKVSPSADQKQWDIAIETILVAPTKTSTHIAYTVTDSDGKVISQVQSEQIQLQTLETRHSKVIQIPADKVQLWWPRGYGQQPLYNIEVSVLGSSNKKMRRIAFRRVELVQDSLPVVDIDYERGFPSRNFYFRINGVPIFAKGANFIPIDSFSSRSTKPRILDILQSSIEANFNMVIDLVA